MAAGEDGAGGKSTIGISAAPAVNIGAGNRTCCPPHYDFIRAASHLNLAADAGRLPNVTAVTAESGGSAVVSPASPSHGENRGSSPLESASKINKLYETVNCFYPT
jgi:hypothetical protein